MSCCTCESFTAPIKALVAKHNFCWIKLHFSFKMNDTERPFSHNWDKNWIQNRLFQYFVQQKRWLGFQNSRRCAGPITAYWMLFFRNKAGNYKCCLICLCKCALNFLLKMFQRVMLVPPRHQRAQVWYAGVGLVIICFAFCGNDLLLLEILKKTLHQRTNWL